MTEIAQSIDLDLAGKLREDAEYRRAFFHAEASAEIARQLIELRKKRELTQAQLAKLAGTGQPAISRCERADYQNWTISTLRSITDALDGRLRVVIEAAEDVLSEYDAPKQSKELADNPEGKSAAQTPNALPAMNPSLIHQALLDWFGLVNQGFDQLKPGQQLHQDLLGLPSNRYRLAQEVSV